jgi:hypothetical protein
MSSPTVRTRLASVVAAALALAACDGRPGAESSLTDADRMRALLAVLANTNPAFAARASELPSLAEAVAVLRRDTAPGADSRRRRALALLISEAWDAAPDAPLLARLGLRDLVRVKAAIAERYPPEVLALFAQDREWREFVVLRALTDGPETFAALDADEAGWFTSLAFAQGTGSTCWRPEEPSRTEFIDPYVTIRTHISVGSTLTAAQVKANIDPQRWDDCSGFWQPPPNGTYLAVLAAPTPSGCTITEANLAHASPNPSNTPGSDDYQGSLFEHFRCQTPGCNAWFKNLLQISAVPDKVSPFPSGTPIPSHLVTYWLPTCNGPNKDGYIDGAILGKKKRVILDEGWMQLWEQDGRTHVQTFKKVQFDGAASTWLAAMILELTELSNEMGELACCEGGT